MDPLQRLRPLAGHAVCCAFPAKPAHATAARAAPARELPSWAICALDAVEKSQELSTITTAATAPLAPLAVQLAGRLAFLADLTPSSRDRRGQPLMLSDPPAMGTPGRHGWRPAGR